MCPIRKFGCYAQHCERPGRFLDLTFGKLSGEMVEGWAGWMGQPQSIFQSLQLISHQSSKQMFSSG